jgi:acyl-CoA reductase-like NAD-dependent aldehyde dehydrogenase
MGLTPASIDRRAFTILEPIGVVAAISAFNHPLNLIVHQVVPAIAVGCPVIVKPAPVTPLSCIERATLSRASEWLRPDGVIIITDGEPDVNIGNRSSIRGKSCPRGLNRE